MTGNAVGLWLALLLLFPELNRFTGEVTYGRLIPVHLNLQLYGWTSLPLVAWLFHIYPSGLKADADLARGALLSWSATLVVAAFSWMLGQNSGKIFLEWKGFARVLFCFNLLALWCVLAVRFWHSVRDRTKGYWIRVIGLIALAVVVPTWFWASSPAVYPAVNPSTSGPTAGSLLGSTLSVVLVLLMAAPLLGSGTAGTIGRICWSVLFIELCVFLVLGDGNKTHHSLVQIGLLAALLPWPALLLLYFREFQFQRQCYFWLKAAIAWFALLTLTGWISFLPEVLDRWKFTNALVAHSHLAMAGFVTCFNLFLLTSLGIRISSSSGIVWNIATFAYVVLMWAAGTLEAMSPGFTMLQSNLRTILFVGRALAGSAMFACSLLWWKKLAVTQLDQASLAAMETEVVSLAA
ncbi:MAG TPA: hypothetical protein VF773_12725 [Verrucomicrobiae bacterium]